MHNFLARKPILISLLALLALGAAAVAVYVSWNGPVGFSDTAAYLASGRNWARGIGLGTFQPSGDFEALTVHPPLYAFYYGALHLLGIDLVEGGRWLNVAAAALATLALGLIFLRHSRTPWVGLLAAVIFVAFPPVIDVFTALMTDGIFIALWLWGMLALFAYLEKPQGKSLLAAVLLFGALPLLRYIGLAFVIASALMLLIWLSGDLRQRVKTMAIFTGGALAPSLLWQLVSYLTLEKGLAGRAITVGQIDYSDAVTDFLQRMANILHAWNPYALDRALTSFWPSLLVLAAVALLAALLVSQWASRQPTGHIGDAQLFYAFGLSGIVFLASIAGAFLFTAPTPDVIERTLLPLLVCILVCAFAALALLGHQRPWIASGLAVVAGGMLLLGLARPAVELAVPLHQGRIGYFTHAWRDSELVERLHSLPEDTPIIASQAPIVLYWADRPAYELIPYLPPGFLDGGQAYGNDPDGDRLQALFRNGAMLVLFNEYPHWLVQNYGSTLTQGLPLIGAYPQGSLYAFGE